MKSPIVYGGQAVLEGVMIRGRGCISTAVRLPDGQIAVRSRPISSLTERYRPLSWPFLRGPIHLVESLSLGVQELFYSVEQVGGGDEKISPAEAGLTIGISFALAIGLFILLPTLLVSLAARHLSGGLGLNLLEGATRIGILLLYMGLISRMPDVQSFFAYHGAEHRVINGWERGADMSPESLESQSVIHARCGTSFVVLVALISVIIFSFFGWPGVIERILIRLITIPLVASVAYEVVRLAGKGFAPAVVFSKPGMLLQRITTREPDRCQVEVALAAFEGARGFEKVEVNSVEGQAGEATAEVQ